MKEIERKWVLSALPSGPRVALVMKEHVDQLYISTADPEVRIKQRSQFEKFENGLPVPVYGIEAQPDFGLTIKRGNGLTRDEFEGKLNVGQYRHLRQAAIAAIEQHYWGYTIKGTNYLLEVKFVNRPNNEGDSVIIAEVEFPSEQEANAFDPTGIFDDVLVAEVTHIKGWKNANLATYEGKLTDMMEALPK